MAFDDDFTAYARARWHPIVHTFVLLGAPPRPAARLATETLTRLHGAWRDGEGWSDVELDTHLALVLLDTWRSDRSAWWGEDVDALAETALPALEPALDRLSRDDRARAALGAGLRLEPHEAADVVRGMPSSGIPPVDLLRSALAGVAVDPPDVDAIVGSSRSRHRRRWVGNLAVGVVGVLVIGGLVAMALSRPPDGPTPPGTSVAETNPVPVPWYADGELHLPRATVRVDDVVDLVGYPGGAVVMDSRFRLTQVQEDGTSADLGTVTDDGSFTIDPRLSELGWIEPGNPDSLVVHDLLSGDELLRQSVTIPGTRVVAFDNQSIYLTDDEGVSQRVLNRGTIKMPGQDLLDLAEGVRLVRVDKEHVSLLTFAGAVDGHIVGIDGRLSDDGAYALIALPERKATASPFAVVDVASSATVALPLPDNADVVSAAFAPSARATFVLDRGVGLFDIVTCDLEDPSCSVDTSVRNAPSAPVLAR